jgi:general stress protein 26
MATSSKQTKSGFEPTHETNDPKKLHEMLEEFSTVLLGTFEQTGEQPSLRARPMSIARLGDDCTLYFITGIASEKVDEAASTGTGHAFGQSKTRYLWLRGEMAISRDRALLRELWSKASDVWFDGPEDPRAAVMTLRPTQAELWDVSGAKGMRFLVESAKALLTGERPAHDGSGELHQKVHVR